MPHADSSKLPDSVKSKADLWAHIYMQLESLLDGQRNWVSNLANASSLIYHSLIACPSHFGPGDRAVNWCGFYIDSRLFPLRSLPHLKPTSISNGDDESSRLLLGPFCGKPACQYINTAAGKARGVCADAYLQRKTLVVPDVEAYPGHIACDGETKSELVCPLMSENHVLGVLDLDCLALAGFDQDDGEGIEKIAGLLVRACDW